MVALADAAEVAPLRCDRRRNPSGFVGVYARRRGGFQAAFKRAGYWRYLGMRRTAAEAALLVAAAYRAEYGPGWAAAFRTRRVNAWCVREYREHRRAKGGGWDRVLVGYTASVWEFGREVVLGRHLSETDWRRDWPVAVKPTVFPTRRAAKAAIRRWKREVVPVRWGGILGPLAIGR